MPEFLLTLRIADIIPETKEAVSFVLENVDGSPILYKAGQFLTLIFNLQHREVRRSYSMSSAPGIDKQVSITVKRVFNGEVSRHLMDHYSIGDELKALAPSGRFTNEADSGSAGDIFLLAAGSGITPVFSLLKEILYKQPHNNVTLIYQNHTPTSTIFRHELENLAAQFPTNFTWIDFVSQPAKPGNPLRKLTNDQLEKLIPAKMKHEKQHAKFFICGPASFMRMCQYTIMLMSFKEEQIRKEYFVIDSPPPAPLISNPQLRQVIVYTENRTLHFGTQYPSTILQSALNKGISLPYSCKGGRCSTCVAHLIKGKVIMSMNDVLTEKDLEAGLILTCVGYAETDVEIEYKV